MRQTFLLVKSFFPLHFGSKTCLLQAGLSNPFVRNTPLQGNVGRTVQASEEVLCS